MTASSRWDTVLSQTFNRQTTFAKVTIAVAITPIAAMPPIWTPTIHLMRVVISSLHLHPLRPDISLVSRVSRLARSSLVA